MSTTKAGGRVVSGAHPFMPQPGTFGARMCYCGSPDSEHLPAVLTLWQRRGGHEVVEIRRVWVWDEEPVVRAHPIRGGRPIVAGVTVFLEMYEPARVSPERPEPEDCPARRAARSAQEAQEGREP